MNNIIFYQSITQFDNTGDLLINTTLVNLLRNHGKLVVNDRNVPIDYLKELRVNPTECLKNYSHNSFSIALIKEVLFQFFNKKSIVYLVSGPGHFYGNSINKTIKNIFSGFYFFVLKLFGCRIVKCGVSLGPLSTSLAFSEAFRSKFYYKYLIRDNLSLQLAKKIHIKNYSYFPDLSWSYNPKFKLNNASLTPNAIFISFRINVIETSRDDVYQRKLIYCLDIILDYLFRKRIIEKIIFGYQVDRDYSNMKVLYEKYNERYLCELMKERISLTNAEIVYSKAKYTISNRLHVLLLCFKYNSLPIALTDIDKHLKIKGIFQDADIEDLLINIESNERSVLVETIKEIISNHDFLLRKIKKNEKDNTSLSNQIIYHTFS